MRECRGQASSPTVPVGWRGAPHVSPLESSPPLFSPRPPCPRAPTQPCNCPTTHTRPQPAPDLAPRPPQAFPSHQVRCQGLGTRATVNAATLFHAALLRLLAHQRGPPLQAASQSREHPGAASSIVLTPAGPHNPLSAGPQRCRLRRQLPQDSYDGCHHEGPPSQCHLHSCLHRSGEQGHRQQPTQAGAHSWRLHPHPQPARY